MGAVGKLDWKPINGTRILKSGASYTGPQGAIAVLNAFQNEVLPAGVAQGAQQLSDDMKAYAQPNAPWQDQTTDARQLLRSGVEREGNTFTVFLEHGVDYGIWLENSNNGRFAIVRPTMEVFRSIAGRIMAGGVKAALSGQGSKVRDIDTGRFA